METHPSAPEAAVAPSLTAKDIEHLVKAARWARVIAILGFVMLGFMILFGALYGYFLNRVMTMAMESQDPAMSSIAVYPARFMSFFMVLMMIVVAAIYFFPLYFLLRFANNTRAALERTEMAKLTVALENLRSHFGYIAVLMIIGVVFYGFFLLIMLGMAAFLGSDFIHQLPQA
jgi:hypothetical protein